MNIARLLQLKGNLSSVLREALLNCWKIQGLTHCWGITNDINVSEVPESYHACFTGVHTWPTWPVEPAQCSGMYTRV